MKSHIFISLLFLISVSMTFPQLQGQQSDQAAISLAGTMLGGRSPGKRYILGFSWWNGYWHGDHKDNHQSVFLEYPDHGGVINA